MAKDLGDAMRAAVGRVARDTAQSRRAAGSTDGKAKVGDAEAAQRPIARSQNARANTDASDEVDRYRGAAEAALGQLECAIRYLHRIRKSDVARGLAKNHAYIQRNLMG